MNEMNAAQAGAVAGSIAGIVIACVLFLTIGVAIGALVLRLAARLCGIRELGFANAMGIVFVNFLVQAGIGLACTLIGMPVAAGMGPAGVIGMAAVQLVASILVSAAIYSAMIPTDFARGLAVWFMQFVVVIGVGLTVGLAAGGIGALGGGWGGDDGPDQDASPVAGAGADDFLLAAMDEVRSLGGPGAVLPGRMPIDPTGPPGTIPTPFDPPRFGPGSMPGAPPFPMPGANRVPSSPIIPPSGSRSPAVAGRPANRPGAGSGFVRDAGGSVAAMPIGWRAEADPPGAPREPWSEGDLSIRLPEGGSKDRVVFASGDGPFVLIGARRGSNEIYDLYDLREGKPVGRVGGEMYLDAGKIAVSPDGSLMAAKSNVGNEVVVFSPREGTRIGAITPERSSDFVAFPRDGLLLLGFSFQHRFELWQLPEGTKVRDIAMTGRFEPEATAISPGGRYVATFIDRTLHVVDLDTGSTAGEIMLPQPEQGSPRPAGLAYKPDGSELAAACSIHNDPYLVRFDATTGEVLGEFSFEHDALGSTFGYYDDKIQWLPRLDAWLVNGQAVVDPGSGQKIWMFPFDNQDLLASPRRLHDEGRMLVLIGGYTNQSLRSLEIPPAMDAALDAARSGGSAVDALLPKLTEADTAGASRIPEARPAGWSARTDPATVAMDLPARSYPIQAKGAHVEGTFLSDGEAAVALVVMRGGGMLAQESDPRWMERLDLKAGRRLGRLDVPRGVTPVALSPDGRRVLLREAQRGMRLDVFDLESSSHVVGWRPYGDRSGDDRGVSWAAFLDSDHILTTNPAGDLVLWEVPAARAVFVAEGACPSPPTLGPGRSLLAAPRGGAVRMIDPLTGSSLGETPAASTTSTDGPAALAFRRDGAELAALYSDGHLARWDVASGRVVDGFASPVTGTDSIRYAGDNHVLIDGRSLIELSGRRHLWSFYNALPAKGAPDGRFWYAVDSNSGGAVASRTLPGDEVAASVAMAADPTVSALMRPGGSVSLLLDMSGPPGDSQAYLQSVAERIAENLRARDVTVVAGASTHLEVRAREVDTGERMELRKMMPAPGESPLATQSVPLRKIELEADLVDTQGRVTVVPKHDLMPPPIGIFRIPEGQSADDFFRIQLWENARSELGSAAVPYFVARRGGRVFTLPGITDLRDAR